MAKGDQLIERVLETLETHRLINQGDKILVALSGGPDSVALLHILHSLDTKLGFRLAAVYINHQLRPRAAKQEAAFCEKLCARLSIPFIYEEVDIPAMARDTRTGVEETARQYRYEILDRVAARSEFNKIAVGHHADDRAETILYNLLRGSGRHGMVGMAPRRGKIIRPLYDLRRDEIMEYAALNRLEYMIDRSNYGRQYTRNRLRHRVIPLLTREISPATVANILRFSEIMTDEERYLDQSVQKIYRKLHSTTPGGKIRLDLTRKLEYDVWFRRRMAMQALTDTGLIDIEYAEVERLACMIDRGAPVRLAIRDKLVAHLAGGALYLYRPGAGIARQAVAVPGKFRLTYPKVRIDLNYVDSQDVRDKFGDRQDVAYLAADRLEGELFITGVKPGARFHPYGRPGSKKVGDFLTDVKYPRPMRDELPVLYDRQGIVWLAGLEIDHRVRVDKETRRVVKAKIVRYQS